MDLERRLGEGRLAQLGGPSDLASDEFELRLGLLRTARNEWARITGPTRVRGVVLMAVAGAVVGWAVPLWIPALRGFPAGATARVIAGLAGLPPHAAVTVAVTLLLAALQVLAGAWLARALLPRRRANE
jgi:Penicillin amidase